jgi:hypothetical protein
MRQGRGIRGSVSMGYDLFVTRGVEFVRGEEKRKERLHGIGA